MNRIKMLNFVLTFISSIITLLELILILVFKNYIAINLFLTQISGFISCIIFIDELRSYNSLKQLEDEDTHVLTSYYDELLKNEYPKCLTIEIFIVILIFMIFLGVPIV